MRRIALALMLLAVPAVASAQPPAETIEYYGTDAIGSIRIVFAPDGTVKARQDYGPFGQPLSSAPPLAPERFGGNTADDEVQQAYFHARQLVARTGRFSSSDTIYAGLFQPQAWNRYAYAVNNPVTFVDRAGLFPTIRVPSNPGCTTFWSMCEENPGGGADNNPGEIDPTWPGDEGGTSGGGGGDGAIEQPTPGHPQPDPNAPDPNPPVPNPPTPNPGPTGPPGSPRPAVSVFRCFGANYDFAWTETNKFFVGGVGRAVKTGLGMLTSGAMARSTGLTTVRMAAADLLQGQGVANMGVGGTLFSVTANTLLNGLAVAGALEVGITLGSGLDATYQTFVTGSCR